MKLKKKSYPDVFRDSPDPRTLKIPSKYLLSSRIYINSFKYNINYNYIYFNFFLLLMYYYLTHSN